MAIVTGFPQMTRSKPTGELVSTMDLNGRKRRYENPSQIKSYWLGTMGLSKKQQFAVSHRKKAILAADESHKAVEASILTPEPLEVPKVASHEGIPHKLRKSAISFFYKLYFRLTTSIEAAVTSIMTLCRIPRGSRDSVRNIIKELRVQEEEPSQPANKSRPWQQLIKDDSVESVLVCTLVQRGIGGAEIASIINERWILAALELDPAVDPSTVRQVSKDAIYAFISRSPIIQKYRRTTKKTGSTAAASQWALNRVCQCNHYLKEMSLSYDIKPWPQHHVPLFVDEVVWFDEKHKQCVLGFSSKWEYMIARNPFDQMPTDPAFGGIFPPRMFRTKEKFPQEARACFGAAMVTNADGTKEGVKAKPFDYTTRFVLGLKSYNQQLKAEEVRVKSLKGVWGAQGRGYKERYGEEDWKRKLKETVDKKYCCVTDIMDWAVAFGNEIHKGRPSEGRWRLFHDALKQWWEKEAQEYLEKTYPGMVARQLRCCLDEMAPLYRGKCVGDSPELCRILDAHGFSDLEKSISHHVAISSFLPFDDDRRFNMGTPKEVMRTMARCWEVAPTSSQIIVYAEKYKEILEKIVAAEGTMVPGTALRSGRRALNHKGDGEIITRLRQSNRKALLRGRILHKDVAWLRDNMLRSADGTVSTEQNIEGIDEIIDRLVDAEEQLEQHMEHADIEREAGDALLMLAAGDSDDDYENGDEEYAYHVLHDTMSGL
jgi:hypothetical protein